MATCFGFEWFYLPPLQFAQMRLGQRFDDPVSLSPPFHLYLKKPHTILLFPLSLTDGHKGRGMEKAWAEKQTEGEIKDHKRSRHEDRNSLTRNMFDVIRFFKRFKSKGEKRLPIKQTKRKQLVCCFSTVLEKQEHQHTASRIRNGSKDC